jgi:hypothetical protein
MVRRKLMGLLVCGLVLGLASFAWAGVPDPDMSTATTAAGQQVSVMVNPDGNGFALNACMAYPGVTDVDATITVTVNDINGDPIFLYPATDMWLESESKALVLCPGGSNADADTDINGQSTFTNPLFAGCQGTGVVVVINSQALTQPALNMIFNSPDINCDKKVDLTDVVLFAQDYYGSYQYRCDFYWDGVLNLSDIVLMAQNLQTECP